MACVLILEDEAVLRLTFGEFLREEGYEVHTAEDYSEAMDLIDRIEFDVVITDIILSGRTGVDLLRTIREQGLNCPVVMITGEPNVETASEAVRLGAFDYLAKPVTRQDITRVARLAVDRRRLTAERDHYAAELDRYRRDLEAIFNSVNEGIITVDADMRIRQANATAESILGLSLAQLAGRPFRELLPRRLEAAREALEQTLHTRKPVLERHIELTLTGGIEKVIVVSAAPLLYDEGAFGGALLMIRDVTRLTRLERQVEETQQYRDMIGKSVRMQEIFSLIKELAETDSTVLIYGESGTGKELVAAALHHGSPRAKGPFLKVNCAALSENILESELFGHVKGAFTGAHKDRIGRFEAANGGTILLDEVGDITPRLQLRLLRVLQEREFERVGSSTPIRTDVRVIASTNQRLERKIQKGEFRQDLYYRLNVVRIDLPALRERLEDIPLLVEQFCRRYNVLFKKSIEGAAPETMALFMKHAWPGNVRELENCIERAFIVCRGSMLLPEHLPPEFTHENRYDLELHDAEDTGETIEQILTVLKQTDWNIAKSARILGMARNTLYQKMKAWEIERPADD